MDVETYITRDVIEAAWEAPGADKGETDDVTLILRAVLPGILAQRRQDVLREAAVTIGIVTPRGQLLSQLADEAVSS